MYRFEEGQLLSESLSSVLQTTLIDKVENVLSTLKAHQIKHGDMKATNWLVQDNNKVLLIDLDGARQYRNNAAFLRAWDVDMRRFLKNWAKDPALFREFHDRIFS